MAHTITVLPDRWMTTAEVAKAIGMSERTVQEMGKDGRLKWKLSTQPGQPHNARVYDPNEVRKYLRQEPRQAPSPASVARRRSRKENGAASDNRLSRALETVSIVGQMVAAMRAETGAQMERWKGDREDARERFEGQLKEWRNEQERWEAEQAIRLAELERKRKYGLWLNLEEACRYSGLGIGAILHAITAGKLVGGKLGPHGALVVRRKSLEEFAG